MSIYVLRSDNLVKIGFSDDLPKRVRAIISSIPVPVEFVGHMPGDRKVEKHLHQRFSAVRFSGEWFKETEEMRSVFDALLTPNLPKVPTVRHMRLAACRDAQNDLADQVRAEALRRWPSRSKAEVVANLAEELGWLLSRAKGLYYKEHGLVLRVAEFQELQNWLASENADAA